MSDEDVYRRLQKHLDRMPVGFPATESGVEIRILKHLFAPDEAEMALHLSALPEPVETIHRRAGKTGTGLKELRNGLNRMSRKGVIYKTRVDGKPCYSKLMLAVGMFEFQVNRLTREFHADVMQYMEEGFGEAFHTRNTGQMRTIPIREEVIPERRVGTFDSVRELVQGAEGPFGVLPCICRQGMDLQEEPCRQTEIRETCLVLGGFARSAIRTGTARKLDRDEVVAILERADDVGMVIQPQNIRDPEFICCCCGCCCGVLTSAKKLPRPAEYFDTNFFAVVDPELCTECETCADRCQMDAVAYPEGVAEVDELRCIGCGLCVTTCPSEAIQLRPHEEPRTPPRDLTQLYSTMMRERFGPLGMATIAGRKLLGMKI
jgi:ferredoxin